MGALTRELARFDDCSTRRLLQTYTPVTRSHGKPSTHWLAPPKALKRKMLIFKSAGLFVQHTLRKLTWLVLGGDPAARSYRVEQFTAL